MTSHEFKSGLYIFSNYTSWRHDRMTSPALCGDFPLLRQILVLSLLERFDHTVRRAPTAVNSDSTTNLTLDHLLGKRARYLRSSVQK